MFSFVSCFSLMHWKLVPGSSSGVSSSQLLVVLKCLRCLKFTSHEIWGQEVFARWVSLLQVFWQGLVEWVQLLRYLRILTNLLFYKEIHYLKAWTLSILKSFLLYSWVDYKFAFQSVIRSSVSVAGSYPHAHHLQRHRDISGEAEAVLSCHGHTRCKCSCQPLLPARWRLLQG